MKKFYLIGTIAVLYTSLFAMPSSHAQNTKDAAYSLSAEQVAEKLANRAINEARIGYMHFTLRNHSGSQRKRSALFVQEQLPNQTKIGIYFTEPAGLRDTGFLSHDNSGNNDQNWLYLPATERVRKLPASSRGDYFMATDLSYGDIKDNFAFALDDWEFSLGDPKTIGSKTYYVLKGLAKTETIKQEMGYASFSAHIDPDTWFPVSIEYNDTDNVRLKEVSVLSLELIDNIWTATHFSIFNTQLSHQTDIVISDMQSVYQLPPHLLEPEELAYGAPVSLLQ
ncbi:outer membrane lipoprotein-sorting protein [Glaciecola sp. SC05]|uniref:outer membrane lipoprotein-sorting protein n=1 Tax=Glaciecola sp. SC05 TaxID=1987355 RepID=UPI003528874C